MEISRNRILNFFLLLLLLLILAYTSAYFTIFKRLETKFVNSSIRTVTDVSKIEKGYTLISPYNRVLSDNPNLLSKVHLLDVFGNAVHTWSTKHQTLHSILKPNGNLLTTMELPKYSQAFPPGGNTGIIQELDWNSNVVWEYKNDSMHHDLVPLKNGNILVALWEKLPENMSQFVNGGVPNSELQGTMWTDDIVEINRKGEIVWSWHAYEHLNTEVDILGPLMPRMSWSFANGLAYTDKNPIDGTPAIMASMRTLNTVYIIRRSDGEILWRSPKGMLSAQHDPTFLPNGNILVFDNGFDRIPDPLPLYGSRVLEINPLEDKIVWQFDGGKGAIDKVRFFAPLVSGAQRLQNGNTLITEGTEGHIFEVTPKGKVVWDLLNPYTTAQTGAFPNNFLFKARKYTGSDVSFPKELPPPIDESQVLLYKLLSKIYPN